MSQEVEITAAAPETPPQPDRIRRGRIGLNVGAQIALGLALFVMVNVLAHRKFKQWDYTYSRSFSLAATTIKFVEQVKEPVRISVLTARENAQRTDGLLERDIAPLLDQYQRRMNGRLTVEYIDIMRDVDAFEDFKNRLYKMGSRVSVGAGGVFVQCQRPHKSESQQEVYFHKWLPAESLYVLDEENKVPIAFRGESFLNTAIAAVTDPERPRIAVVTDTRRVRRSFAGTMGDVLSDICSAQNIELEGWRMLEFPEDMSRYKLLIFAGTYLFGEQQDAMLTKFFETAGNAVLVLLDPFEDCVELNAWVARYGIQPQNDRVLTARSTGTGRPDKQFAVDARFLENSPITETLVNQITLLPPQTRSLKILAGLEKQRSENIKITPLLTPGEYYWGEKKFTELLPQFDQKEDNGSPLYVAASLERGAATDPRVQMQSSRMVVVGNAALSEPPIAAPNYDFITRSLNWLLHRDVAAANDSSTDKAKHKFRIDISPAQWQRILIITTIVLPLAALMAGMVIWSTRRN